MSSDAQRFARLFSGNVRSHGEYRAAADKQAASKTIHSGAALEDYEKHIAGEIGLGIVPITDEGWCRFGVLDIDTRDLSDEEIAEFEYRVREADLPLVVCRSKSGGIHAILVLTDFLVARDVKKLLERWASELGHKGCEVFPKQSRLRNNADGSRQFGNWINLPYFNAADTQRYCIEGGKRIDFEFFLETLENRAINAEDLAAYSAREIRVPASITDSHPQAPPCVQRMMAEGVARGNRNDAMYNAVVYFKKAFPNEFRDRSMHFNQQVFDSPLLQSEFSTVLRSASRPDRDYFYKCHTDPCRSLCNKEVCFSRQFGMSRDRLAPGTPGSSVEMPAMANFKKILTVPPTFEFTADGVLVRAKAAQFMSWRSLQVLVQSAINKVVPSMKEQQFRELYLDHWLDAAGKNVEEVPDELTNAEGVTRSIFIDWLQRAERADIDPDKRKYLLNGVPLQLSNGVTSEFVFRIEDFRQHMKRTRNEEVKDATLYLSLRLLGMQRTRFRVGKHIVRAWKVVVRDYMTLSQEPEEFKSEY